MSDSDDGKVTRMPGTTDDLVGELLRDPILDPVQFLKDAIDQLERLREEWQEARDSCDDIQDPEKLLTARQNVRAAWHRYEELKRVLPKLEADVRRRTMEIGHQGEWRSQYDNLLIELRGQYQGLGPHYDLLCEHLASVTLRIRMIEASGRDVGTSEFLDLHKLQISYVQQLQRYTESMKSETVSRLAQEVAVALMQIADRHFGTTYPVEFQMFVGDVRAMIEAGGMKQAEAESAA